MFPGYLFGDVCASVSGHHTNTINRTEFVLSVHFAYTLMKALKCVTVNYCQRHQSGQWSISALSGRSSFSSSFSSSSAECAVHVPHLSRPEVAQTNSPARALGAAQRKPFCSLLPPPLPRSLFTQRWHIVCSICLSVFVCLRHESTDSPSRVPPTLSCSLKGSLSEPRIWPPQREV